MPQRLTPWIHAYGTTYGAWLRGDARGWRARHHREHCAEDPTDLERDRWKLKRDRAARLMEAAGRAPVRLTLGSRRIVMQVFESTFFRHDVIVWTMCVDEHHFHVLARFPMRESNKPTDLDPWASERGPRDDRAELICVRRFVGIAKKDSARALLNAGLVIPGGVWGTRCGLVGVRSYEHLAEVDRYIGAHGGRGAEVWRARQSAVDAQPTPSLRSGH